MLKQLAVFAYIFFWITYRAERLNNKQPVIGIRKFNLVNSTSWDHEVITIVKRQFSIHRAQYSFALMHKNHFIRISIFVEILFHAFLRCSQHNMTIIVDEHRYTTL